MIFHFFVSQLFRSSWIEWCCFNNYQVRSIILSIYVCVRRSAANKQQTKKTNSKPCAPCFSFFSLFSFFSFFPTETKNGEHRQHR